MYNFNAGFFMKSCWAILRPLFPEYTRDKIVFVDRETILEDMDPT